jgi:hydrogenase expression/formation protein HypE
LAGGKLPAPLLAEVLAAAAVTADEVVLGPAVGEDAAAIELPDGVLVAATDPITLTGSEVGAYAVVINANDVAVMGVRPRWFLAAVLLPRGTREDTVRELFAELRTALDRVGAVLIGGHAEVTGAVSQPVVVGQMLGHRGDGRIVTSGGATPGDVVLQVGPAPVEGAAVLALRFADRLGALDEDVRAAAAAATDEPGISVVEAALAAAELGATAMHDPTEGGLAAGLHEVAVASDVALSVDEDAVVWFTPGVEVCAALDADPWATLASGALLATFPAPAVGQAERVLAGSGWEVARIAETVAGTGVTFRSGCVLDWPQRDEVARLLDGQ